MKTSPDKAEIARQLREHIKGQAASNMPPPVSLSVYDGSRQFEDGYVWALHGDKRVQCIAPGPLDLTAATVAAQIVITALPPNPDEPGGAYFLIGGGISGTTNSRAPALMTTGVSIAGGGSAPGSGTVTSVALSATPTGVFDVSGSPITSSGTITLSMDNQSANTVFAGPSSGGAATPAFRTLVAADLAVAVILAPTTDARNVIQPTADTVKGLVIKGFSATQSDNLQEWQSSAGTLFTSVGPRGQLTINAESTTSTTGAISSTQTMTNPAGGAVYSFDSFFGTIAQSGNTTGGGHDYRLIDARISTAADSIAYDAGGDDSIRAFSMAVTHNGSGTLGTVSGGFSLVLNSGSGRVVSAYAYYGQVRNTSSGFISNGVSFRAAVPIVSAGSITNLYGLYVENMLAGATLNYAIFTNGGTVLFNSGGDATSDFNWRGDTDNNALFCKASTDRVGVGVAAPTTKLHALLTDAGTNAVVNVLTVGHDSSGTPAAGFGAGLIVELESSTTAAQSAGRLTYEWATATHASRKALSKWTVFDTAEREAIRIEASGTAPMIGFYGTAAVAQPTTAIAASTFVANTSGIADDTATWDGYTIGQVVKALRNEGLLA